MEKGQVLGSAAEADKNTLFLWCFDNELRWLFNIHRPVCDTATGRELFYTNGKAPGFAEAKNSAISHAMLAGKGTVEKVVWLSASLISHLHTDE